MNCPKCGHINPPSTQCCSECGVQLDFAARSPGGDYRPTSASSYSPLNPCAGNYYAPYSGAYKPL